MISRTLAMMAWLLPLAGAAEGDECDWTPWLCSTAHCLCRVATNQGGSVHDLSTFIKDFGTVGAYYALFPQNSDRQNDCRSDCDRATGPFLKNKGEVCDA